MKSKTWKRTAAVVFYVLAIAAGQSLWATEVTIGGFNQSGAAESQFATLYGNGNSSGSFGLSSGADGGGSMKNGLIEFYVQNYIPADATITNVTLTMYIGQVAGSGGSVGSGDTSARTLDLYDVTAPWQNSAATTAAGNVQIQPGASNPFGGSGQGTTAHAGDATWQYSSYSTIAWSTPGGAHVGTDSASLSLPGQTSSNAAGVCGFVSGAVAAGCTGQVWSSTKNPQMTADVQAWVDGKMPNYGWELINLGAEPNGPTATGTGASCTQCFRMFYTNSGATLNWEPTLTVDYTVPEPATLALLVGGLAGMAGMIRRRRLA